VRESGASKSLSHKWLDRLMGSCPAIPPFTSIAARQDDKKRAKAEARSRGPSTGLTALPKGSGSLNHEEPETREGGGNARNGRGFQRAGGLRAPFATARTDRKAECPRPAGRSGLSPLTFPIIATGDHQLAADTGGRPGPVPETPGARTTGDRQATGSRSSGRGQIPCQTLARIAQPTPAAAADAV